MRVFRTKEFSRFARREKIGDCQLCDCVDRAAKGLIDAELGGGLIKQRVARQGQGRRGGFRTLLAFHISARAVFLYGFAKNERANIDPEELVYWQTIACAFNKIDETTLSKMIEDKHVLEVTCDED